MIALLRGWGDSWVSKLLLVLIILSLGVFWGMGSIFRSEDPLSILATVGEEKILVQDLQGELSAVQQRLGRNMTPKELKNSGLLQSILLSMVNDKLLSLEAKRLGLRVSDAVLQNYIRSQSAFEGPTGQFSRQKFESFLRRSGQHENRFLERVRSHLLHRQILRTLLLNFGFPTLTFDLLQKAQNQVREGSYAFLSPVKPQTLPSKEQLQAFYENGKERYRIPEKRSFSLILISPENLKALVEKDVKLLGNNPQEKIYYLSQELEDRIAEGTSLSDIAQTLHSKRHELTSVAQGSVTEELSFVPKADQKQEIVDLLFKGKESGDARLKRLKDGSLVVLKVESINPAHIPSFQEALKRVREVWLEENAEKLAFKKAQEYAQNPEKLSRLKLTPAQASFQRSPEQKKVPPEVKTTLFNLGLGQVGAARAIRGGAYVVQLSKIKQQKSPLPEEKREEQKSQIKGMLDDDVISAYLHDLRSKTKVRFNNRALSALFQ